MSEDQSRTFVEAESFPVESFSQMEPTNYRSSIDPSIVVIESTCTVTDHLKVIFLILLILMTLVVPNSIHLTTNERL